MKSTTYIVEITNQKNEKYLYVAGAIQLIGQITSSLPLALCQLRNFLHVFTGKCFAVFDQSSCAIDLRWYQPLLFFWESFLLWYDIKILVKSREGGTFLSLAPSVSNWQA